MSVISLPEWKQLLLERKRREEEEREIREKKEEEKLASMPAWKRGIIQRRRAKQEALGDKDREKEREAFLLLMDSKSASDGLNDMDSSVNVILGSEQSHSPDPGQWLDTDTPPQGQVSMETIVPVHENPFILTQSGWRKGREVDQAGEMEQEAEVGKDKETEKASPRGQYGESGRGRELEVKTERIWDRSKERKSIKDLAKEREYHKARKQEERDERRDLDPPGPLFAQLVPSLRTIRANNIIIIERDVKGNANKGRWREAEREITREDHPEKRGVKMDLRELLTEGGNVTGIKASEVLIIKPSTGPEERVGGAGKVLGREDGVNARETKCSRDGSRDSTGKESRPGMPWLREEREPFRENERPWGQATVIKDKRKDSGEDGVFVERGGRVSQLLSKFGEHPKPSRSKSSENFRLVHMKGDQPEDASNEKKIQLRGVPKRSYSFSDRVLSSKENGVVGEGHCDRRIMVRTHPERKVTPCVEAVDGEGSEKAGTPKETELSISTQHRAQVTTTKNKEVVDERSVEVTVEDKGFTVASVKNTEGISFARKVQIRQDGRTKTTDIEVKRLRGGKKTLEKERNIEEDREGRIDVESMTGGKRGWDIRRGDGRKDTIPAEIHSHTDESHYKSAASFRECSSLLCTVEDSPIGSEWNVSYLTQSILSQHTVELISQIERVGETTACCSERGEGSHRAASDLNKHSPKTHDTHNYGNAHSENLLHVSQSLPKSPKRITPIGIPPRPLEIQIPRTVFYVAEEAVDRAKRSCQVNEGLETEGERGVERRDSWRIGKPLSRVESLREKIRQRERIMNVEGGGMSDGEAAHKTGDLYDERELEMKRGWEAASQMRKKLAEADRGQEGPMMQTDTGMVDVTQDINMLKNSLQLPVSLQFFQAVRSEEVTNGYNAAVSDALQTPEDDGSPLIHVEVSPGDWQREYTSRREPREDEEEELSQEENYSFPTESLTLSPPFPNSLAAMSRIYNLKTVGSRTGMCVRERTTDIPSAHLNKVKPLIFNAQQEASHQEPDNFRQRWGGVKCDDKVFSSEETSGVQAIQCQVEQLQLKEQEVALAVQNGCTSPREHKTQETQRSRSGVMHQEQDSSLIRQQRAQQTSASSKCMLNEYSPSSEPKQNQSNQSRSVTITPKTLRSHSPDDSAKPSNYAPTPASSPTSSPTSSPPLHSPTVSPSHTHSTTPSPKLFTIKSASGGQVKRGATITITPKKSSGREAVVDTPATPTTKPPAPQTPIPSIVTAAEPGKNRYPTVEEIEVIGGYQNLEKSCLVKNRGTPKRVKVCFDEDQLEQVCEYPSETSMLACTPDPLNQEADEWEREKEEEQEEEEKEMGTMESTRSMGTAMARVLRVDNSC